MVKYCNIIELDSRYESVVDEATEQRNPGFWENYIVHEDMARAIERICSTFKPETPDDQRSFWFHGTYGTGKSYSALVLKHLFEDPEVNIQGFMSRQKLLEYKNNFLSIRKKGKFLVIWKSGCTGINSGNRLMMEMEHAIRSTMLEKIGPNAYLGRKSLIESVKDKINDPSINWQNIFEDTVYQIDEDYASFEKFRELVMANDMKACDLVANVIIDKGWGLIGNVDQFKAWITDVIEGNDLKSTGIIFIWDEFTGYLRQSKDDNVLQNLSEFCKQQPFYMMLIVHRDSAWLEEYGEESYARMVHRYHELEFNISESAAYQLIGDSILVRPGMEETWKQIQHSLLVSISSKMSEFAELSLEDEHEIIKNLCPIHPMTLTLLSKVAGNFAASQRTLFRFLKDTKETTEEVGFIYYINNYGPDDWCWLTPDFLWDYFFMRDSDVRKFGDEARACYRHFQVNVPLLNDKHASRIFKAAMLLIAVMGTSRTSYRKQKTNDKKIKPSINTLINCFAGQLDEADVKKYIEILQSLNMLLTIKDGYDYRIERPYDKSAGGDDHKKKKDAEKRKNTLYVLLGEGGEFSRIIVEQFLDANKAISKRIEVVPCSAETISINTRLAELNKKLEKASYKFGILLVVPKDIEQFHKAQEIIKDISEEDETKRLVVAVLKKPLDENTLDEWYDIRAHQIMAADAGMASSAEQYKVRAHEITATWVGASIGGQMVAYYNGTLYAPIYGKDDLARKMEQNIIFQLFYAAPEKIVKNPVTLYNKRASEAAALAGVNKNTTANAQIMNMVDAFKTAGVWEIERIEDFQTENKGDSAKAVGEVANFICKLLADNPKVNLQQLWLKLQEPPFGYYDNMVCAYILGFIMRFYANSSYYWFDGTNPNIMTENNLATMIGRLCKDNVAGNTLAAGSETDRRFREITQKVFELAPHEAANEEQIRKYVRVKISKLALPFWTLKYIPAEKFGSTEMKTVASSIVNKYINFIMLSGDQDSLMEDVLALFKGKGNLRQILTTLVKDTPLMHAAFKDFIVQSKPGLDDATKTTGIDTNELLDEIKKLMQDEVWSWTEEQVFEKLDILYSNIRLIACLNNAMGANRRTIEKLREDLSNRFERMKVPGLVLISLEEPWTSTLAHLREIEQNKWLSWNVNQKEEAITELISNGKDAWSSVVDSKLTLGKYLKKLGFEHNLGDIVKMYEALDEVPYYFSESSFKNAVLEQRRKLAFERDRAEIVSLWISQSGVDNISAWCEKYGTPIQWVMPQEKEYIVQILYNIQKGNHVDAGQLKNALNTLKELELDCLRDDVYITKCFFVQTDERFIDIIEKRLIDVKDFIKSHLGNDVYAWANNTAGVRKCIERYIREKLWDEVILKAKNKIQEMSENKLKEKFSKLMEENPDLCMLVLKG